MLQSTLNPGKGGIKIGTLLIKAGLVSPEAVALGLQEARLQEKPIGSVLVNLCHLRHKDLSQALYLQVLVNEGILDQNTAVKALNLSHSMEITAKEALIQLKWEPKVERKPDRITELMLASGFLSHRLYNESVDSANPIGISFVMRGIISCAQLNEVLAVASLISQHIISNDEGVDALSQYRHTRTPATIILKNGGLLPKQEGVRLGDLMVAAGLIGEADLLIAVEQSLRAGRRLGDWLIAEKAMAHEAVSACLDAQHLLTCGVFDRAKAVMIIKRALVARMTVPALLKERRLLAEDLEKSAEIMDLLNIAEVISRDIEIDEEDSEWKGPIAALALSGRIRPNVYKACKRLEGRRKDEAVVLLQLVDRLNCTFDEALQFAHANTMPDPVIIEEEPAVTVIDNHQAIAESAKTKSKQTLKSRFMTIIGFTCLELVVAVLAYQYFPNVKLEVISALTFIWFALCLGTLHGWEKEDDDRATEVNLAVQFARRKNRDHKSKCA